MNRYSEIRQSVLNVEKKENVEKYNILARMNPFAWVKEVLMRGRTRPNGLAGREERKEKEIRVDIYSLCED